VSKCTQEVMLTTFRTSTTCWTWQFDTFWSSQTHPTMYLSCYCTGVGM